jgi:proline dehydrogenase|tara:strand:+ start:504 stop:1337 length:834 start_codon:yes stop_codon:yes gene_type:complete
LKLLLPFAKRFIAGENLEDASEQIVSLQEQGFRIALNLVGESGSTSKESLNAQNEYLKALKLFPLETLSLSIKPSLLSLDQSIKDCLDYLTPIVEIAHSSNQKIRFDMENSAITDSTIEICRYLNELYPNVIGVALQANLFRTADDLAALKSENISIRLVKGAYREDKSIAFIRMDEIRDNFLKLANILSNYQSDQDAIATHDEVILSRLLNNDRYKKIVFEFLFGVRRDLQKELNNKHTVGIYIPYGSDWFPYTMRRLSEWKNIKFIARNLLKEKL